MKRLRVFWVVAALAACLVGCQRPEVQWNFTVTEHNGSVVWDMTGLCLKFEGARLSSGAAGRMIISSSDVDGGMLANVPGDTEEIYDGETGINTLKFQGHVIKLQRTGTLAEVDGVSFALKGKPKQIITIHERSQPTIRDFQPGDATGIPLGELGPPAPDVISLPPTRSGNANTNSRQ